MTWAFSCYSPAPFGFCSQWITLSFCPRNDACLGIICLLGAPISLAQRTLRRRSLHVLSSRWTKETAWNRIPSVTQMS